MEDSFISKYLIKLFLFNNNNMNDARRRNPQGDNPPGRNTKSALSKLLVVSNNCDFDHFWDCRINFVPWDASLSYCGFYTHLC